MKNILILENGNNTIITPSQLAEAIANIYNTRTAGWYYQHWGQSRNYDAVEDMCGKLESTLFCGRDIVDAIKNYGLNYHYTIDQWAVFIADSVAQRITKNQYQDVTFEITLKK